jgi:LysM repeat protein
MAGPAIVAGAQAVRSAAPRIIAFIRKNGFAAAIKKYGQSAVQKAVDAGEATVKGGRMSAAAKPRVKPKPQKKGDEKITANQSDRIGGASTTATKQPKTGGNLTSSQKKKAALGAGIVAATPAIVSQVGGEKKSYTIKSGDTLSAIAKRMGVRLSEIKEANPQIKDLNKIRPGQKIKVPKASIKGTGKSIYEGMSKSEMKKLAMKKKKKRGSKTGTAPANTFDTGGVIKANAGASVKPNRTART